MSDNENTNENPNSTSDNEREEETELVVSKTDNPKKSGFTMEEILVRKEDRTKRKKLKSKEFIALQKSQPKVWEIGKKLPYSKTQDGQSFFCYYHDRKTPDQHKQDLLTAYGDWQKIYDTNTSTFPLKLLR